MNISEFDFYLPKGRIATEPAEPRDSAKMLVLGKEEKTVSDSYFFDLPNLLKPGDVLVLNDSKVIPARLQGKSDNKHFEVLLIKNVKGSLWECWMRPGKKAIIGLEFHFSDKLKGKLIKREEEIFFFEFNLKGIDFINELEKVGEMPVPPYIIKARKEEGICTKFDEVNYQTVFAEKAGSVAAPTAGLHFTQGLIQKLHERGVCIEKVTLHVGLGTFQPINTDILEDFQIHSEYYEVTKSTADRLIAAKKEGRRIIAVGTTSTRVLESVFSEKNSSRLVGETRIYIYPGYKFKFIDGMITNFHLPKSSLLLLVSAFAGKEFTLEAYRHAIENNYLFYSYGDGMLIL